MLLLIKGFSPRQAFDLSQEHYSMATFSLLSKSVLAFTSYHWTIYTDRIHHGAFSTENSLWYTTRALLLNSTGPGYKPHTSTIKNMALVCQIPSGIHKPPMGYYYYYYLEETWWILIMLNHNNPERYQWRGMFYPKVLFELFGKCWITPTAIAD